MVLWLIILALCGLALFILTRPVRLEIRASGRRLNASIRWLGLTASYDAKVRSKTVSWLGLRFWSSSRRPAAREKPVERSGRRFGVRFLLRHRAVAREVAFSGWRAFKELMRRGRWERCRLQLSIGTEDPAVTGILFGYATAARPLIAGWFPQAELELQPDFESGRTHGEGEARFGVRPLDVMLVAARLAHRLPKRKLLAIAREIRRKRKTQGGHIHGTAGSA